MQLYTMEIGTPPFYSALNRAIREKDPSQLKNLGPAAQVYNKILSTTEKYRSEQDKVPNGQDAMLKDGGLMYNMHGIYLLMRGVNMTED